MILCFVVAGIAGQHFTIHNRCSIDEDILTGVFLPVCYKQPEGRRDGVIRCLINFLGESCEDLITDYRDVNKDMIKDSFPELAMMIIVLGRAAAEGGSTLENVIIIIDGTEVLDGCKNLMHAFCSWD